MIKEAEGLDIFIKSQDQKERLNNPMYLITLKTPVNLVQFFQTKKENATSICH